MSEAIRLVAATIMKIKSFTNSQILKYSIKVQIYMNSVLFLPILVGGNQITLEYNIRLLLRFRFFEGIWESIIGSSLT